MIFRFTIKVDDNDYAGDDDDGGNDSNADNHPHPTRLSYNCAPLRLKRQT